MYISPQARGILTSERVTWLILSSFVTQSAINEARSDSLTRGIENQAGSMLKIWVTVPNKEMI